MNKFLHSCLLVRNRSWNGLLFMCPIGLYICCNCDWVFGRIWEKRKIDEWWHSFLQALCLWRIATLKKHTRGIIRSDLLILFPVGSFSKQNYFPGHTKCDALLLLCPIPYSRFNVVGLEREIESRLSNQPRRCTMNGCIWNVLSIWLSINQRYDTTCTAGKKKKKYFIARQRVCFHFLVSAL
jgi:hypothetical protein